MMAMAKIREGKFVPVTRYRRLGLILLFCVSVCLPAASQGHPQIVRKTYADSNGRVHIVNVSGKEVILPKEKGQESVEEPVIAGDNRTVGWLVNFPNCCTSYPIPMTIVLYRDGRIIQRLGNGMGVFKWYFVKEGEQVAYYSDTVHSNLAPQLTLADVASGKTLEKWVRGDGILPAWATFFAEDVGPIEPQ
jgi:hypothetical protein